MVFDVAHSDQAAETMGPRKRRRMTEEQRAAAAERLEPCQPRKGEMVQDLVLQALPEAQIWEVATSGV